ncbi:MAG: zf-TFIIB domain-containing protein [Leptolyngbyaceae cyanobacterium SM1_1_3]|nr:zf-TFIIB domain-containing protein [Leptolyngbyaceae cyanobacterium SM1_1_3]NJM85278.1 zf-TFIIB domain-containing protein [Leptolyngbyaceae cyanobacterium RM2_2_21]NJN03980.1 zf-TFIIB domain-containing protein [Leptolyngbyaceae cyanobacterium RM1_1_2]NJO08704.1 zf-TFIIB domain-containing protein [Leptolyngbyaceae cyanobacterium SL_1_1]
MECPKQKGVRLNEGQLAAGPTAYGCPECHGNWISTEHYSRWQAEQSPPERASVAEVAPSMVELDFAASELDNRAALCPDCSHYLVRARVNLKHTAFYLERCPNCKGIWCDRGEWQVLQQLGLHTHIDSVFSSEWQNRVRELEQAERERQATADKLGLDLAQQVFQLAEKLENHPNGDFGVAYLMRRFNSE